MHVVPHPNELMFKSIVWIYFPGSSVSVLYHSFLKCYDHFLASPCPCCCTRAFSSCSERASHGGSFSLWSRGLGCTGFSSCARAQYLPHGTWNLPGSGIEPVFPASGFLTTGSPGKPFLIILYTHTHTSHMHTYHILFDCLELSSIVSSFVRFGSFRGIV